MNIYYLIIGACLFMLLAIFGHHPLEEAKKAHDAKYSQDPLIGATEEYFDKKPGWGGISMGGGGSPIGNNPMANSPEGGNNGFPTGYSAEPHFVNGVPVNNNYPTPGAYGQEPPPLPQDQNTTDYYPPPPPGVQPSPLQEQQEERQQQQYQQNQDQWP